MNDYPTGRNADDMGMPSPIREDEPKSKYVILRKPPEIDQHLGAVAARCELLKQKNYEFSVLHGAYTIDSGLQTELAAAEALLYLLRRAKWDDTLSEQIAETTLNALQEIQKSPADHARNIASQAIRDVEEISRQHPVGSVWP